MKNMVKSKLKKIKEMKITITRIDIACASLSMAGLFFQVLQSDEYFSNSGKARYESNSEVLSYRIIVSLLTLLLSKSPSLSNPIVQLCFFAFTGVLRTTSARRRAS